MDLGPHCKSLARDFVEVPDLVSVDVIDARISMSMPTMDFPNCLVLLVFIGLMQVIAFGSPIV
jgi:hypothetical protein